MLFSSSVMLNCSFFGNPAIWFTEKCTHHSSTIANTCSEKNPLCSFLLMITHLFLVILSFSAFSRASWHCLLCVCFPHPLYPNPQFCSAFSHSFALTTVFSLSY